ncbi:hypothetical protein FFZ77_05690 [Streptomyces katsurahamanus]|uniref:Uncharacterized protein n=1 Tax=Streptomyces katsurahamanus TaxID=2577098 RepID=A0ABW9NPG6_9ACTN|nr:hypothetical protein [Streptomyces katsurahamanus]
MRAAGGDEGLSAVSYGLSFDGPGDYRVRVHARGRDTAVDRTPGELTEWYLLQVWPAPAQPPHVLTANDQYGTTQRAAVPDSDATITGPCGTPPTTSPPSSGDETNASTAAPREFRLGCCSDVQHAGRLAREHSAPLAPAAMPRPATAARGSRPGGVRAGAGLGGAGGRHDPRGCRAPGADALLARPPAPDEQSCPRVRGGVPGR